LNINSPVILLGAYTRQIRRQRNREAQHIFRQRRQAAALAQTHRIQHLEQTVEEMSRIFTRFLDEVLETQAISAHHPTLLNNLQCVSARILSLAKGAVDVEESVTPPPTVTGPNTQLGIGKGAEPKQVSASSQPRVPISDHNSMNPIVENSLWTSSQPSPGYIRANIPSDQETIGLDFQSRFRTPLSSITLPRQVFGNGWTTSTTPVPYSTEPFQRLSPHIKTALSALGSFSLRLLEATLFYGYRLLLESVPEKSSQAGLALCSRTPQQLTALFRWLLGPGKEYMYQMSGIAWENNDTTLQPLNSSAPFFIPPCSDTGLEANHPKEQHEYLTVIDVQRQLQSLGAKVLDADTMELWLDGSQFGTEDDLSFFSSGSMPPASWSYIDFFSIYHTQPSTVTMRLRVPEFVQNMTQISTCLGNGPGYSKRELARVMKASASIVQ
jgi:hypothetical protein